MRRNETECCAPPVKREPEAQRTFDRRGARAVGHAARPPAPFSSLRSEGTGNTNKSHGVTPFWHNDTRSRVTVTFGARRKNVDWRLSPGVELLEWRNECR
jgi:hypothetical protein